jgi:hypothetical protein
MKTVEEIKSAIARLGAVEMRELHEWLEHLLEDQLELTPEFKANIEASEREMRQGKRPRLRQP